MRIVLLAACASLLAVPALASARAPALIVRPAAARPGATVAVRGNAGTCPRGDTVFAISRAFPGRQFGLAGALSGRVRAGGAFSIAGHLRRGLARGTYTVTARCGGGNLGVRADVRIR
jgi:hypothetical protein